ALTLDELKMEGWQVSADEVRRRVEAGVPDALATIVYTSGTTGPPKGVVQTHANHFWMVANLASAGDYSEEDENLLFLPLAHSFAAKLIFSAIRNRFGGRLRFAVSGAAPLSREIMEFFHAAGVLILEGYGLTETAPALTMNTLTDFRFGTVGKPIRGVELKLA